MYMVDLEKAEEAEIKLPKSVGSQKNQENFFFNFILFLNFT